MKPSFKPGVDERIGDILFHDVLVVQRRKFWLKLDSRLPRPEQRAGGPGNMTNVNDGRVSRSPSCEQGRDVLFCLRIISFACGLRGHAALHINDNEGWRHRMRSNEKG